MKLLINAETLGYGKKYRRERSGGSTLQRAENNALLYSWNVQVLGHKQKEIVPFAKAGMDLEDITLSEIS